ncbi:NAD(P)-binding protein [Mollisia scopiformis]|uniref:NAD(P)-binding protein n=1 Tax=Mollisia scopiformis TaxID=149040 RepID=A0A194X4Y0_MOLSC|nr:NAD(P)-binding protein [Mollisia scopiformis]KUJ15233.1 NAD(P)-binding protein [Mollisia scopiformis]
MSSRYAEIHKNPKGPGDARPTALQILKDQNLGSRLQGKTILITGCSSGIGVETAKALHTTGAILYLTARNLNKAKEALADIVSSPRVNLLELDLNSLASVRACAKEFLSQSPQLNIFIANAGVMATPEGRTEDGFETQFGTNHLAHFLLFNLLKSALLASSTPEFNSRAILLSSISHRISEPDFDNLTLEGKYHSWVAYGASKTANLWTANEIERRYGTKGLHAWAVQPGGVLTNLAQHLPGEEAAEMMKEPILLAMFKNPDQGASTSVWAAVASELEGQGGKFLDDCQISGPAREGATTFEHGTSTWAFDEVKEGKLWKKSLELVGLKDNL